MDLNPTPEEAGFRKEVRGWLEANLAYALRRDDMAEGVRRILNDYAGS